ncbi:protein LAZ1 1-like [Salvia divinorum]|uniref:Protein LAZ1 1-like n=1 Tax=Salvia divinorum TaxID=28513 RepID=A0ABD1GHV4_SALDI
MGWKVVLLSLLHIATVVDAMSRSERLWSLGMYVGTSALRSWVVSSAAIFVLVAVILSMYLIFDHLIAYNQPEEQKFLVPIILMVPVYSVESFLSLLNSEVAFNCQILRDCYEAFALYCFERYLIACLGGEESTIKFMEDQSLVTSYSPLVDEVYAYGIVQHPFPLNCFLRDWKLGSEFYQAVKIGVVQYMTLKMICALLAVIFESWGVYGEGKFDWGYAYPYLAVVLNFSQTWALYCLVQFYSVTKNKLAPIKPLAKFLAFKSIVFLTWWQGVAIAFLFSFGAFKGSLAQVLEARIQDYFICLEMGVAAVIHIHVFPAEPYRHGERCERNVAVMTDYAALETPPDPEEVQDCERSPTIPVSMIKEGEETHPKIHQSVCDVLLGSGGIMVDDVKFTVSHVVEPVERGLCKLNRTFRHISENMKKHDECKDDCCLVPLNPATKEIASISNSNL